MGTYRTLAFPAEDPLGPSPATAQPHCRGLRGRCTWCTERVVQLSPEIHDRDSSPHTFLHKCWARLSWSRNWCSHRSSGNDCWSPDYLRSAPGCETWFLCRPNRKWSTNRRAIQIDPQKCMQMVTNLFVVNNCCLRFDFDLSQLSIQILLCIGYYLYGIALAGT